MTLMDRGIVWYFRQNLVQRGKSAVARHLVRRFVRSLECASADGVVFDIDPRDLVQLSVLTTGEWEPDETAVLRKELKRGDVVYDIGANFGYMALLASKLVGPEGRVVALEPSSEMRARLERNVSLNAAHNVEVFGVAASDRCGASQFYVSDHRNSGRSSLRDLGDFARKETIEVTTIDSLADAHDLPIPGMIKIDVEGAEVLALRGMRRLLGRARQLKLLIEVSDQQLQELGSSEDELLALLDELGFTQRTIVSQHRRTSANGRPLYYNLFATKGFDSGTTG